MVDGFPEGLLVIVNGFRPGPPAALCFATCRSGAHRELKRQQQELDPFQLLRIIQAWA